jgi:signal transduction histidine kinase
MEVLIISDEAEFPREIVNRWNRERSVPAFSVVSSAVWQENGAEFDLAVVSPKATRPELLQSLNDRGAALLCVVDYASAADAVRDRFPQALVLRAHEGWLDSLVLLGSEVLHRVEANTRAIRAEDALAAANRYVALGRYVLDMRHNLNNALTSVLGNAELMLLEPSVLPPEIRDQVETIHSMALRINEVMQRFSSLDNEMQSAEKQKAAHAHAGAR